MHESVRDGWQAWNDPFEGTVYTFYNDIKGLTTIGVGNLCNTVGEAMQLQMVRVSDGQPASPAEIAQDWHRVHDNPTFAKLGWTAAARGATVRLTKDGVHALVMGKLERMEKYLAARFPEWDDWPWQAQTATLSMAWAAGPAVHAPHWEKACKAREWLIAAVESHLDDAQNPGLRPRNAANAALFVEAAALHDDGPSASEDGTSDTLEGKAC